MILSRNSMPESWLLCPHSWRVLGMTKKELLRDTISPFDFNFIFLPASSAHFGVTHPTWPPTNLKPQFLSSVGCLCCRKSFLSVLSPSRGSQLQSVILGSHG
jgi:hypothetical protein